MPRDPPRTIAGMASDPADHCGKAHEGGSFGGDLLVLGLVEGLLKRPRILQESFDITSSDEGSFHLALSVFIGPLRCIRSCPYTSC